MDHKHAEVEKSGSMDQYTTRTSNAAPSHNSKSLGKLDYNETDEAHISVARRVWDSFRRNPNAHFTPAGLFGAEERGFKPDEAVLATATSPLSRKLKSRHIQMIAIGGSVGELAPPAKFA